MPLDREAVQRVVDLLKDSTASELEVDDGEVSVRAKRAGMAAAPVVIAAPEADADLAPPAVDAEPLADGDAAQDAPDDGPVSYIVARKVGLFHWGSGPDAEPLVTVGTKVREDQVVATIEALRKLTEVTSPFDGEVVETLVEDGEPVQFGQKLFAVRGGDG